MFRPIFTTLFFGGFLLATVFVSTVSAQILLDPNASPTSQSGIIIGSPGAAGNPFGLSPNETPSTGGFGSQAWGDSHPYMYGGGMSGFGTPPIHPKMTREEILQRQTERKIWLDMVLQEQISRTQTRIEARQNMERGLKNLRSLFNESESYVPQTLGGYVPESEITAATQKSPNVPLEESPNKPSPSLDESALETTETVSSEDKIDQELRNRRAELEKQEDSEQKRKELEALKRREDSRRRRLQQRAEAERGADYFAVPPALLLSPQRLREGWCLLFDGKTSFGWRVQEQGNYGGGSFLIRNGEIRSDPEHPGLLYTTNQFGDSTVMFEYQAEEDSEAYLLLRTSPDPRDIHSRCYAVVLNSRDFTRPTGTVLGRHEFSSEQLAEGAKSPGKANGSTKSLPGSLNWSRITAQFEGNRLQVWLDREEPITLFDPQPLGCGYLGLLVTKGDVRFRKMQWKPGSTVSLFDPVAPDRFWRFNDPVQLKPTREGTLQLTGGPGVFESKMPYGNFVIQFEYNIAYSSERSSLFFRCIPRAEQSGYEMSIQNFPTRADRDQFVGVDVGSFRGVKKGRYLRPDDQNWNYVTLLAVDRQFQTWVNGVPVCEMSDMRPETEGAETPPFLEPGSIQFLAPKAGTNVDFRNIRISTIAPRFERRQTFEDRAQSTWESQTNARRERERQAQIDRETKEQNAK